MHTSAYKCQRELCSVLNSRVCPSQAPEASPLDSLHSIAVKQKQNSASCDYSQVMTVQAESGQSRMVTSVHDQLTADSNEVPALPIGL